MNLFYYAWVPHRQLGALNPDRPDFVKGLKAYPTLDVIWKLEYLSVHFFLCIFGGVGGGRRGEKSGWRGGGNVCDLLVLFVFPMSYSCYSSVSVYNVNDSTRHPFVCINTKEKAKWSCTNWDASPYMPLSFELDCPVDALFDQEIGEYSAVEHPSLCYLLITLLCQCVHSRKCMFSIASSLCW